MNPQSTRVSALLNPNDLLNRLKMSSASNFAIQSFDTRLSRLIMEYEKSFSDLNKTNYKLNNSIFKISNFNQLQEEKGIEMEIQTNIEKLNEDIDLINHMKDDCIALESQLLSKQQMSKQIRLDIMDLKKDNDKIKVKSERCEARVIQIKLENVIAKQKIEKLLDFSAQLQPMVDSRKSIYKGYYKDLLEINDAYLSLSNKSLSIQRTITAKFFVLKNFDRKIIVDSDQKEKLTKEIEELEKQIDIELAKEENMQRVVEKIEQEMSNNLEYDNKSVEEKSDLIEERSVLNEKLFTLSNEADLLLHDLEKENQKLNLLLDEKSTQNCNITNENELFDLEKEEKEIQTEIDNLEKKKKLNNCHKFTSVKW